MKPAKKILQSAMRAVLLFTAAAAILLLCGSSADFRGRYMSVIRYERATGQKIEEIYDTWKVTPSSTGDGIVTRPAYPAAPAPSAPNPAGAPLAAP